MRHTDLLATAALLACGLVQAAQAAPAHPPKGHVIIDQTSGGNGGLLSDNFADLPQYSVAAADAFKIKHKAAVTTVIANGAYFNGSGPATSENVTFYADAKGKPGKIIKGCAYANVNGKDADGSFTLTLKSPCKLTKGIYWISVVANISFAQGGEWLWAGATETGPYQEESKVQGGDWQPGQGGLNYELLGSGH